MAPEFQSQSSKICFNLSSATGKKKESDLDLRSFRRSWRTTAVKCVSSERAWAARFSNCFFQARLLQVKPVVLGSRSLLGIDSDLVWKKDQSWLSHGRKRKA